MRGQFYATREFYIPKGSVKVADKLSDAVAYVYGRDGKFYAAIFVGKQAKPIEHCRYRDAAKREQAIAAAFQRNREHAERMANRKTERTTPSSPIAQCRHWLKFQPNPSGHWLGSRSLSRNARNSA